MIKAAVFADTHTNIALACGAIRGAQPDCIIHLGDHDRDAAAIHEKFPDIPMYSVCGNCDVTAVSPIKAVIQLGPVKAFITHGHYYNVNYGTDRLAYAAAEAGAQIAMYGHTHIPDNSTVGGVAVINPGTAGRGRDLTWALVTVFDNGGVACEIKKLL